MITSTLEGSILPPSPSPASLKTFWQRAVQTYHRTVTLNPWIPHKPHPKQQQFLLHTETPEVLYGGAAGGGKSDALLMAAAQYVDTPGYAALLIRCSFSDLMQPEGLIPRSKAWWMGSKAHWHATEKRWTFPSGASIGFGYLGRDDDVYQYQGAAFQCIAPDELTQHSEFRYRYLFSRLRRLVGVDLPLRMRSGSNPGGIGHEWVKKRFLGHPVKGRAFVPAKLADNPSLDAEAYKNSLAHLDPLTRAQLLAGDWDAHATGRFKRQWFANRWTRYGTGWQLGQPPSVRYVDLDQAWVLLTVDTAASVKTAADYTVISAWAVVPRTGELIWLDCFRAQLEVPDIIPAIERMYRLWSAKKCVIETVAGHSGTGVYQALRRTRMVVIPWAPKGDKLIRATDALNMAEAGKIYLPDSNPPWLEDAEAEVLRFTGDEKIDAHDDVVDTVSMAATHVVRGEGQDTSRARPGCVAQSGP